ncbi:MAG: CrcB protein [Gammaproteobacteria bacterium]|jgi:CrcB protein|nr:CrcB protein [Gammaproteobacteria bacterium]
MFNYLLIGLGGALGAMARVGVGRLFPATLAGTIPVQMMAVNVIGCFVMGLLSSWLEHHHSPLALRYFLITGVLGGFTTFSAFALEGSLLLQKQQYWPAAAYIGLTVVLCLAFFFVGSKLFLRLV